MLNTILKDKYDQLVRNQGSKDAKFSKKDIDQLFDVNELRTFKMSVAFPKDFTFSSSKEECVGRLMLGDNWSPETQYRVLEYCVILQPVLQYSVEKVFRNWRFINGPLAVQNNRRGPAQPAEF